MGRPKKPPAGLTEIRLDEAVDKFMAYLRTQKRRTSGTPAAREVVLRTMQRYLGADRQVFTLTRGDLLDALTDVINGAGPAEAAQRSASGGGGRPRTGRTTSASKAAARTAIKQFAEFCHDHNWLPLGVAIRPKEIVAASSGDTIDLGNKVRFRAEQWPEVLDAAGNRHPRLRIAVALGLYAGLRVSAQVRVQVRHIDLARQVADFFEPKTSKEFQFPLYPELREELDIWWGWALSTYGEPQPDWYLIPGRRTDIRGINSKMLLKADSALYPVDMCAASSIGSVYKDTRKLLAEFGYGTNEGTGTHTWRRSAARVIRDRYGLKAAQAFLRHEHSRTTEVYVGEDDSFTLLWDALMPAASSPADLPADPPAAPHVPEPRLPDNVILLRPRGRSRGATG